MPESNLLQRGSRGSEVRQAQKILKQFFYYTGKVDGIFGPKTEQAVIDFQNDAGIQVDGIIGPQTRAAMQEDLGNAPGGPVATPNPGLPPFPQPPEPTPGTPPPADSPPDRGSVPGGSTRPAKPTRETPAPRPAQAGISTTQALTIAGGIVVAGLLLPSLLDSE